jgi:hypothetical protein
VGIARPPKAIHTAIYAEGACPYIHKATHNRHTESAGLPWWSFGSRRARIACRGSPIRCPAYPSNFRGTTFSRYSLGGSYSDTLVCAHHVWCRTHLPILGTLPSKDYTISISYTSPVDHIFFRPNEGRGGLACGAHVVHQYGRGMLLRVCVGPVRPVGCLYRDFL